MSIHPVQAARYFTFESRYDQVDWAKFPKVIDAFRIQMEYWYVLPTLKIVPEAHYSFAVLANTCMLVDSLSQYEAGKVQSARSVFKNYLRKTWPMMATAFPTPIQADDCLNDYADVLYGVRCGILHENHTPLYAGLVAQNDMVAYHPSGFATYGDGSDCPVVTIDPRRFFEAVQARFDAYLKELVDPNAAYAVTRTNFKTKFEDSYGVTIAITV